MSWSDVLACERVVTRFTAAFDAGDLEGMLAEFAPDGVWTRQEGIVRGHGELETLMAARRPGLIVRHVITNMRVTATGPDAATCTSYVTVYRYDGGSMPAPLGPPTLLGTYHDELRRSSGAWLLSGRRVTVEMKAI